MPTLPRPRYLVRLSARERAHQVIDTRKGDEVMGSFYWDTATYFGQPGIEAQQLADKLNYDDARPMSQIDTAALARQLVGELNEYDARGLPCDERYEATSAEIRGLGYDIGPDGSGALCLYDPATQRPLIAPNETPDVPTLTSCRIALPGGWWAVVDERGSFCGVMTETPMA